jgi:outer membrane protein insertion porin family
MDPAYQPSAGVPRPSRNGAVRGRLQRPRFPRAILVALAALGAVLAARAGAQVPAEANLYKGWAVDEIEVHGVDSDLASAIEKGLALSEHGDFFTTQHAEFMPSLLEEDLARMRLFLAQHGYPDAGVEPRFQAQPRRRRLRLILQVDAGPRVRIGTILVEGGGAGSGSALARFLPFATGDPFIEKKVQAGAQSLLEALRAEGYAEAKVTVQVERDTPATARVVYRIEPGAIQFFGDVIVQGIAEDLVPVAKRSADIARGQRYAPRALKDADENLRLLGLFRHVQVEVRPSAADTLDVLCDLEERDHRSLHTGVGFWTDELVRLEAGWEHRNILKKGRGLAVNGTFSYYEQQATVSYWRPALFSSRTRLTVDEEFERRNEESFESLGAETEVALTWNRSFATTLRAALASSYTRYGELSQEVVTGQEGLLTDLSLDWFYDGRNDKMWPSSGGSLGNHLEWGLPVVSQSHYVLDEIMAALFHGLGAGVVFAARLGVGVGDPTRDSEALVADRRFFAGGATSMRGFGRNQLGPKDTEGRPVGGEAKLESSLEVRFPLVKPFLGAVFMDAGQVWREAGGVKLSEVEVALGGSLMLKTPIGPLRFDVGHRVTDFDETEPRTSFHFLIGNPF